MLIAAFALGQMGPNAQLLLTAAGASGTIFEIIDRVSVCCVCQKDGKNYFDCINTRD